MEECEVCVSRGAVEESKRGSERERAKKRCVEKCTEVHRAVSACCVVLGWMSTSSYHTTAVM